MFAWKEYSKICVNLYTYFVLGERLLLDKSFALLEWIGYCFIRGLFIVRVFIILGFTLSRNVASYASYSKALFNPLLWCYYQSRSSFESGWVVGSYENIYGK